MDANVLKTDFAVIKAPAKRSQHANATYRNIVGRNMLRAFGHRVAMYCDMLGVVGLSLKLVKFEPTTPNMSQHSGRTHATCCAQQCCNMLCWHVAIVWPGLKALYDHEKVLISTSVRPLTVKNDHRSKFFPVA